MSDRSRYRKAMLMIRRGDADESIRIATGLPRTVIQTLRNDLKKKDEQ
jgi:hypothetical protein